MHAPEHAGDFVDEGQHPEEALRVGGEVALKIREIVIGV